ncbi:NAD(P)H-binding protein [Campylobacter iguaniorum]|uniref:NAD(P)H-binding protein n=1 Tax=Campylobacter iguaniorum TaxID=1244531 RepID=UPI0007C95FA8|nr:NAD(P)H-binding protein [Campylobacter iguaniorum]
MAVESQLKGHIARNLNMQNDRAKLIAVITLVDAVYAGLACELEKMATNLVQAMNESGVKRLVSISAYGIYGETNHTPPKNYINSAKIIESSNLDYTIIRSQWFSNVDEINYEITHKNKPFANPDAKISRKSIADLVGRCIFDNFGIRDSLGINRK